MDTKTFTWTIGVKEGDQGLVEAEFATLNAIDLDGDVTLPGAFGEQRVKLAAWGHNWGELPVGKGAIGEKGEKAVFDGQFFLDTAAGKEHFATVKNLDDLQEWSYGFQILEALRRGDSGFDELINSLVEAGKLLAADVVKVFRFLKKLNVFEVSPVMRGAGIGTRTTRVKAEKGELQLSEHADEVIEEVQALVKRYQSVADDLDAEGRLLSDTKRERLFRLVDLTQSVRDEIAELLKRTEQPTPEKLLGLRDEWERLSARIERVGAG